MLFVALDLGEGSMAQASAKRPNVTPRREVGRSCGGSSLALMKAFRPPTSTSWAGRLSAAKPERYGRLVFVEDLGLDEDNHSIERFACD